MQQAHSLRYGIARNNVQVLCELTKSGHDHRSSNFACTASLDFTSAAYPYEHCNFWALGSISNAGVTYINQFFASNVDAIQMQNWDYNATEINEDDYLASGNHVMSHGTVNVRAGV